jgi:hypothetical protein
MGVAVLVAILGSSTAPAQRLTAFQHGWTVIAAIALLSAVAGAIALPGRVGGSVCALPPASAPAPVAVGVDE